MCATGNCVNNRCAVSSCTNSKRDGDETGVDCGGSCSEKCDGDACTVAAGCKSRLCVGQVCAPSGTKSCGVGVTTLCENGKECGLSADCASDVCTQNGVCEPPGASVHDDGVRNGGETGVDCGGTAAPAKLCKAGGACKKSADCEGVCPAGGGVCAAPSGSDGKQNQAETSVDCGGPNAGPCALGLRCESDTDCVRIYCDASKSCSTPTSSDGIKNGRESDIDCGGGAVTNGAFAYTAPRCKVERQCRITADCGEGACSPKGLCLPPSCATSETGGIDTCGVGEPLSAAPFTPAATHETCCRTLKLPSRNRRLDKYEITAGRYRSFINTVAPDVRGWAATYIASHPTAQLSALLSAYPTVRSILPATYGGSAGVHAHLGNDMDNYSGGIRGCFNGAGASGGNTYWPGSGTRSAFGLPPRVHPREVIDAKSLTCQTPVMLMAFCAWDGGELASLDDMRDAWGPATYPWGATDEQGGVAGRVRDAADIIGSDGTARRWDRPTGKYLWCNGNPPAGPYTGYPSSAGTGGWACQNASLPNNGVFYAFPAVYNTTDDQTPWVGAPGRFPYDRSTRVSPVGGEAWADLMGSLAEYTGDFNATGGFYPDGHEMCDFSSAPAAGAATCTRAGRAGTGTLYTGLPTTGMIGATWEGHEYMNGGNGYANAFPSTFQYGKFGGRCVRPMP